ncbi:GFA family protein [Roseovarius sp. EL26]|uniref:GFA family protein n=1 Tax=Roseovarius sp. EL26 TaxID=2126672 RepID=UPI000EA2F07F|nr:GFA family protein [Roseovarius sp. EL26]
MTTKGHCLCGAVSYAFEGAPTWTCYCHCESCRRNCAAPVTAFLGLYATQFRWTGAQPASYESTPGIRRLFCSTCGTPMAFDADHYPGDVHLYIATLENPSTIAPTEHVHFEERLPWFSTDDDMSRVDGSSETHTELRKNHKIQD